MNNESKELQKKRAEECRKIDKSIVGSASLAAKNLVAHKLSQNNPKNSNSSGPNPNIKTFQQFFTSLEDRKISPTSAGKPQLGKGIKRGQTLDFSVSSKQLSEAKKKAIEIIKNKPHPVPVGGNKDRVKENNGPPLKKIQQGNKKLFDILNRVNKNLDNSNVQARTEQINGKSSK